MSLSAILEKNKSEIVRIWVDMVLDTYPSDGALFMKKEKDPFSNPVGSTTRKSLEDVFDALLADKDNESVKKLLDPVIRIRAVQEFTPSEATSFVFFLKSIVRKVLKDKLKEKSLEKDLRAFDIKVDALCLIGFDIFMGCREQIYHFRANHVKDRTMNLLQKANLMCEVPDVGTEIIPHHVYKEGGFNK